MHCKIYVHAQNRQRNMNETFILMTTITNTNNDCIDDDDDDDDHGSLKGAVTHYCRDSMPQLTVIFIIFGYIFCLFFFLQFPLKNLGITLKSAIKVDVARKMIGKLSKKMVFAIAIPGGGMKFLRPCLLLSAFRLVVNMTIRFSHKITTIVTCLHYNVHFINFQSEKQGIQIKNTFSTS